MVDYYKWVYNIRAGAIRNFGETYYVLRCEDKIIKVVWCRLENTWSRVDHNNSDCSCIGNNIDDWCKQWCNDIWLNIKIDKDEAFEIIL